MESTIRDIIKQTILDNRLQTKYREPLLGTVSTKDIRLKSLKDTLSPIHLTPEEILPEARSIFVFFLPFSKEVSTSNKGKHQPVSTEWALAYAETNRLINEICINLNDYFAKENITAKWQPATHNFDPVNLNSYWSHKSMAYLAGLGHFGLHSMLITPKGCAGRFGSMVLSQEIEVSPVSLPDKSLCKYLADKTCGYCWQQCPTGALTETGLNKELCYSQLLQVQENFKSLGTCDVCGKCSVGPCAYL